MKYGKLFLNCKITICKQWGCKKKNQWHTDSIINNCLFTASETKDNDD